MEEMVNDGLDSALDNEDMEDEIEEEVDKVLEELAVETTAQLPASAVPRVRVKPTAEPAKQVLFTAHHIVFPPFLGPNFRCSRIMLACGVNPFTTEPSVGLLDRTLRKPTIVIISNEFFCFV